MPAISPKPAADLLVVGIGSPLLAGLYVDGVLTRSFRSEEKTSKALPPILHDALASYRLEGLYYARGPGSFMAIKVVYVMLKTLSITLDIPLRAADAFAFNGGAPIRAVGRSCFVKEGREIVIRPACPQEPGSFFLPERLDRRLFSSESRPLYVLPAV